MKTLGFILPPGSSIALDFYALPCFQSPGLIDDTPFTKPHAKDMLAKV